MLKVLVVAVASALVQAEDSAKLDGTLEKLRQCDAHLRKNLARFAVETLSEEMRNGAVDSIMREWDMVYQEARCDLTPSNRDEKYTQARCRLEGSNSLARNVWTLKGSTNMTELKQGLG